MTTTTTSDTDAAQDRSACPRGCTGPEQGGSGCIAVIGECAQDSSAVSGDRQYSKKPVVIEAIQWTGRMDCLDAFNIPELHQSLGSQKVFIPTLEGTMIANVGDWIIRGINGEFYPCKPDIFAATYENAALTQPVKAKGAAGVGEVRCFGKLDVLEAWACVRKHNSSIADDALDDMREVLLLATSPAQQAATTASAGGECFKCGHAWHRGECVNVTPSPSRDALPDWPQINAAIAKEFGDDQVGAIKAQNVFKELAQQAEGRAASQLSCARCGAGAWKPLTDSQWVNIVNHDHAYENFDKDEAVYEAVKRTEAKLKEINTRSPVGEAVREQAERMAVPEERELVKLATAHNIRFPSNQHLMNFSYSLIAAAPSPHEAPEASAPMGDV